MVVRRMVVPIHDLDQGGGQDIPVKDLKINWRGGNGVVLAEDGARIESAVAQTCRRWSIRHEGVVSQRHREKPDGVRRKRGSAR